MYLQSTAGAKDCRLGTLPGFDVLWNFACWDWFLVLGLLGFAGYGLILIDLSAVRIILVARLLFRV